MRTTARLLAAATVVAACWPVPALATPAGVAIDVRTSFESGTGTFTAEGGVVCGSGTTDDDVVVRGGRRTVTFHVRKTFTCADGSGTFVVQIQARLQPCDATNSGNWVFVDGTGAYEGLRGAGSLVGTYAPGDSCTADRVDDHLVGSMILR
jgi:hypothetical protein